MRVCLALLLAVLVVAEAAARLPAPAPPATGLLEAEARLSAARQGAGAAELARASALIDAGLAANDAHAFALDAWRKLIEHRFAAALTSARRAQAAGDESLVALACEADALTELGRYDDAEAVVQRLLDAHYGIAALSRAAHLRMLFGDLDGARALTLDALARTADGADRAWLTLDLAALELMAGRAATSLELARAAVAGAPTQALAAQARAWRALGAPPTALALWRAVAARETSVEAWVEIHALASETGDAPLTTRAAALIEGLARLDGAQGGRDRRSVLRFHAARGEWRQAHALARADLAERPDVYADAQLAWSAAALGEAATAREHAERALRLGTADPVLRWQAGSALAAAGDARGAPLVAAARAALPWLPAVDDGALAAR